MEAQVGPLTLRGVIDRLELGPSGELVVTGADAEVSEEDALLEFAACMRENGVEDFEDPDVSAEGEVQFNFRGGGEASDVDRETQIHGLAAVLGFVSNTGIAGLTVGGGFGYLSRKYGWTSDNVRSMNMVTADGKLVRASETENADLFWGLRGGGGNFG